MLDLPPPSTAVTTKPASVIRAQPSELQTLFPPLLTSPSVPLSEALRLTLPRHTPSVPVKIAHVPIPETLPECIAAFEKHSGARLLFTIQDTFLEYATLTGLPNDPVQVAVFDDKPSDHSMPQLAAVQEALRVISLYPEGFLGELGIQRVGLFKALLSAGNDGHHVEHPEYPGLYRFNGLTQKEMIVIAAHRWMGETLHHELFHAIDQTKRGQIDQPQNFEQEGGSLARILAGEVLFPPVELPADLRARIEAQAAIEQIALRAAQINLTDGPASVSPYSAKSPNELKAELHRFIVRYPNAFLQEMISHPEGKTAQATRLILHEMDEAPLKPFHALGWLTSLAEHAGGSSHRTVLEAIRTPFLDEEGLIKAPAHILTQDGSYKVSLLIDSMTRFLELMKCLSDPARKLGGIPLKERTRAIEDSLVVVEDLAHTFGTGYLLQVNDNLKNELQRVSSEARAILPQFRKDFGLPEQLEENIREFQRIKVERFLDSYPQLSPHERRILRHALILGAAATVWINGATGVLVHESGLVITNHHVVKTVGQGAKIIDARGTEHMGECVAALPESDLALVRIKGNRNFPWLPFGPFDETPVMQGSDGKPQAFLIGNPHRLGWWNISSGDVRKVTGTMPPAKDGSTNLGNLNHGMFTLPGSSGSPGMMVINGRPVIGFLHNSYEDGERYGISLNLVISAIQAHKDPTTQDTISRLLTRKLFRRLGNALRLRR